MAAANGMSPGCGCCDTAPTSCSTTITGVLLPLAGTTRLCPPPLEIDYEITGTTTDGKPIDLTGTADVTVANDNSQATFALTFDGVRLPAGNYSVHIFERGAICGQAPGVTGRFDGTTPFQVICPRTTVALTLLCQFDLAVVASNFAIRACNPNNVALKLIVAPTVNGPASECGRTVAADGNIILRLKVTAYPFTVEFDASGADLFPVSETRTGTGCGTTTSDWKRQPFTWRKTYPIVANGCSSCNPASPSGGGGRQPLPGATVTLSGGVTGQGVTSGDGTGTAILTAYAMDKAGTNPDSLLINWTVIADRFVGASYTQAAYQAAIGQTPPYPGSL